MEKSFATSMSALLSRSRARRPSNASLDFIDAAFQGDIPRLRVLVEGKDASEKARLADMSFGGLGALKVAARMGRLDIVKLLVEEFGFNIDGTSGGSETGLTALCSAALDGKLDTVNYLLDHGADPNKETKLGPFPLHCASKYGHGEVAKLMLSRGAKVDAAYADGSALHIAAFFGQTKVMEVLLEYQANPNLVSDLGTPLTATLTATEEVIQESISLECAKLLVKAGADVNCTGNPLAIAAMRGLADCTKYLLEVGANANIPHECCGSKPIEIAVRSGKTKLMQILLKYTSRIDAIPEWTIKGIGHYVNSKRPKSAKHKPTGDKRRINSHYIFMRIADLPEPDIVITVGENDSDPFRYKEQELRDLLADHPDKSDILEDLQDHNEWRLLGPHPLLEPQANARPPSRWFHAKLQLSTSTEWCLMLILRADNMYVKGFAIEHDGILFCYEITEPVQQGAVNDEHPEILPLEYMPISLPWDLKYRVLLDCENEQLEEKMKIMDKDPSIRFLTQCDMQTLTDQTGSKVTLAKEYLAGLIFKFCEYARMKLRGRSEKLIDYVHYWKDICIDLRLWKKRGYKKWSNVKLSKIGIKSEEDVLGLIYLVLNEKKSSIDDSKRNKAKKVKRGKDISRKDIGGTDGKNSPDTSDPAVDDDDGMELQQDFDKNTPFGRRRVQLLTVSANIGISTLNIYDSYRGQTVYISHGNSFEDCEEDLLLTGPRRPLCADGMLAIEAFPNCSGQPIVGEWDPYDSDDECHEPKIHFRSICGGLGAIEIGYLLIHNTIEAEVKALLCHRESAGGHCSVSGTIKAHPGSDFGRHSIILFSQPEPIFVSTGPVFTFAPSIICLPYRPDLELQIEIDLKVHLGENVTGTPTHLKFAPGTPRTWTSLGYGESVFSVQVNFEPDPSVTTEI